MPASVHLLFVAEAPPSSAERYFYFPDVKKHDSLWSELMKALYPSEFGGIKRERQRKHQWLTRFSRDSNLLVDVLKRPLPSGMTRKPRESQLREHVDQCVAECRRISPNQIVLIKTTVYDVLYKPLKDAGLPVVNERLPFPGSGRQGEFQSKFARLVDAGLVRLV